MQQHEIVHRRDQVMECQYLRSYWKKKRRILSRLGGIQRNQSYPNNPFLHKLEKQLQADLESVLVQEELLWHKKSRCQWMLQGDRNTRYFHTKTVIRRQNNRVNMLKNSQGEWVEDAEVIKQMACSYFHELFSEEGTIREQLNLNRQFYQFPMENLNSLEHLPTMEELRAALFPLGGLKAPGEDGFPAVFF